MSKFEYAATKLVEAQYILDEAHKREDTLYEVNMEQANEIATLEKEIEYAGRRINHLEQEREDDNAYYKKMQAAFIKAVVSANPEQFHLLEGEKKIEYAKRMRDEYNMPLSMSVKLYEGLV